MNSSLVIPGTYELGATSAYTLLQPMSKGSVPFGPTYKLPSSWKKFIPMSTQRSGFETAVTVIPTARTTTQGPTVLKPAPLPEDYDARVEEFLHFLDSFESGTETTDDVTAEQ